MPAEPIHPPLPGPPSVKAGLRQIPAGVWVLGFVSLLMDISSEMVHSLLPLFMVTTLGASAFTIGLIEGLAESTALIVKVFSGVLSDYLGRRKGLALFGYALGALLDTSDLFAGGREGFIVDLYVLPTARRAGVGGALVAALREWFVEQGALQIVLNVDSANAAGRAFWQALGGSEYQIKMRIDLPDMPRASDGSGVGQMESKIP